MLTTAMLEGVTKIVTHDHCPDGLASAIILLDAYHDRLRAKDVEFVSYNSERHNTMPAKPGMLFCDFSPPLERAQEFVDAGTIVLDHHKKERVDPYGERGVFGNTKAGESGAVLAFREVWCRASTFNHRNPNHFVVPTSDPTNKYGGIYEEVQYFAFLAGVRDTWQKHQPEWRQACEQTEALMFYPRAEWLDIDDLGADWSHIGHRLDIGRTLYEKRQEKCRDILRYANEFTSARGRRIVLVNTLETSDVGEMLNREPEDGTPRPSALIGFQYLVDGGVEKIQLSCRSTHDLLVEPFAKSFPGGGGHDRAAGFKIEASDSDGPYRFIEYLWNEWEATQ